MNAPYGAPTSSAGNEAATRDWLRNADREIIRPDAGYSVRWAQHGFPEPRVPRWSYHPEYELHHIARSEGRYLIGDKIGLFGPGHVALVGPYLPHDWVSLSSPGEYLEARDTLVQFSSTWLESSVAAMPELSAVLPRLEQSAHGIVFLGRSAETIGQALTDMGSRNNIARLAALLEIFDLIAKAPDDEVRHLDAVYERPRDAKANVLATVDAALDYILKHLDTEVRLADAARQANMSDAAFSRYFRKASGVTFSEMTAKIRISNACRLLDITDEPISVIAGQVGYPNLSNFNKQFKRIMGTTPREHRRTTRSKTHAPHTTFPG